ncbi:MAG TPA: hydroxyacid dehydrogenase [Chloroflexota bacterium]|nr:hydroxyacid dehydrogenase [Chloroflexota bacterium]
MRIATVIADARYRLMLTETADARLDTLGEVRRAAGDTKAVAAEAPNLLHDADVILTGWGSPPLREEWLDQAPNLRLICHCAGSVRGIIPTSIYQRGVTLCHAAPIIADSVAEFCISLELLWLRRPHVMDRQLKAGVPWREVGQFTGALLAARRVGLVGSGYVAQRHIRLLLAFGAQVRVADPYLSAERAAELGVERASLEEVFSESEIIAIHAPKTPETHRMITADLLARIKPDAILIQNARSWVVDQEALLRELRTGRFVAAIDVFDQEPQPPDSPFFALDNVIVTPHVAGHSRDSHERQGLAMVEEVERFCRGEPLRYAIAAERYELLA